MKIRDLRLARDSVQGLANRECHLAKNLQILLSTRPSFFQLLANLLKMAYPRSVLHTLCGFLLLLACSEALKFDLQAFPYRNHKSERCIRNFVSRDTLVVVTATIDGIKGDGMIVNMHVSTIGQLNSFYSMLILRCRSKMQWVMSTGSRRMSLARREWHSHPTPIQRLMSVLRI